MPVIVFEPGLVDVGVGVHAIPVAVLVLVFGVVVVVVGVGVFVGNVAMLMLVSVWMLVVVVLLGHRGSLLVGWSRWLLGRAFRQCRRAVRTVSMHREMAESNVIAKGLAHGLA